MNIMIWKAENSSIIQVVMHGDQEPYETPKQIKVEYTVQANQL